MTKMKSEQILFRFLFSHNCKLNLNKYQNGITESKAIEWKKERTLATGKCAGHKYTRGRNGHWRRKKPPALVWTYAFGWMDGWPFPVSDTKLWLYRKYTKLKLNELSWWICIWCVFLLGLRSSSSFFFSLSYDHEYLVFDIKIKANFDSVFTVLSIFFLPSVYRSFFFAPHRNI